MMKLCFWTILRPLKPQYTSNQSGSQDQNPLLTYDLDIKYGGVTVVLHLHRHVVLPGVAALGLADEDDAVAVCVADADVGGVDGLPVLQPGDLRPGFTLERVQVQMKSTETAEQ